MPTLHRTGAFAATLVVAVLFWPQTGRASCGATFCSVNTQWETQGAWTEPGLRIGLRYEYTDQDQLRHGRDKTAPAGVLNTHDELRTLNRNLLAGLDYAFDPHWSATLQVPFVQRRHAHVHNDLPPEYESWQLSELGDVRALGSYRIVLDEHSAAGVRFGLKLPTGKSDAANDLGVVAERSLQPGSGTTDTLLGGYYHRQLEGDATTLFVQGLWQRAIGAHKGYEPGQQLSVDVGLRYALTLHTAALLQLNALWKDHDRGINAEPDESGGSYLFLSPGLSYSLSPHLQVYGFVQLPLYQYVNGTQLTADWSLVAGLSWRP